MSSLMSLRWLGRVPKFLPSPGSPSKSQALSLVGYLPTAPYGRVVLIGGATSWF